MPLLNVRTVSAEQVWTKGDLTIWALVLDYGGKQVKAKTYSKAISNVGWSGEVETYEKQGRNGSETFVKQPQKEGGFQQGGSRPSYGGGAKPAKPEFDNFTMYLSYAKDIAIACIKDGKFDGKLFSAVVAETAVGGTYLFTAHNDEGSKPSLDTEPTVAELNATFPDDSNFSVVGEEIVDPWET